MWKAEMPATGNTATECGTTDGQQQRDGRLWKRGGPSFMLHNTSRIISSSGNERGRVGEHGTSTLCPPGLSFEPTGATFGRDCETTGSSLRLSTAAFKHPRRAPALGLITSEQWHCKGETKGESSQNEKAEENPIGYADTPYRVGICMGNMSKNSLTHQKASPVPAFSDLISKHAGGTGSSLYARSPRWQALRATSD